MSDATLDEIRRLVTSAKGAQSNLAAANAVDRIADLIAQRCAGEDEALAQGPTLADKVGKAHPPLPGYIVAPVMAPSRLLTFSNIAPVLFGETSLPYKMSFEAGNGWLIGMRGSVVDQTGFVWRSSIGLQLEINDGDQLITDGERATFVNYDDLFTASQVYFPLRRYVTNNDNLYASFQNFSTDTDLTPTLTLFFCRDQDMRKARAMYKSLKDKIC